MILYILGCGGINICGIGDLLVVVWKMWIGVVLRDIDDRELILVDSFLCFFLKIF